MVKIDWLSYGTLWAVFAPSLLTFGQGVVYVDDDATGANNGASWTDAYTDLQSALDSAAESGGAITEIRVAQGLYHPSSRTDEADPRSATYKLTPDLQIYGGFAGDESTREDRNWEANPTILSGDRLGDDMPGFVNRLDNAYHVLLKPDPNGMVVLDGFTVRGGHATGGHSDQMGGGLRSDGDIIVQNCTFEGNWSGNDGGGAVAIQRVVWGGEDPATVWRNCVFRDNASSAFGGAVYLAASSTLTFSNCKFERNTGRRGGAIATVVGHAVLEDCEFSDNVDNGYSSTVSGGALATIGTGDPSILHIYRSRFLRNSAPFGGAISTYDSPLAEILIEDSHFEDNRTERLTVGGALYIAGLQATVIRRTTFRHNLAWSGGAIYLPDYAAATNISECLFENNHATGNGGAAYAEEDAVVHVSDSTFVHNSADDYGGGAYFRGAPIVSACLFERNSAATGGGVYLRAGSGNIVQTQFLQNHAVAGGGLAVDGYGFLNVQGSEFVFNHATTGGGMFSAYFGSVSLNDVLLSSNWATYGGGFAGGAGDLSVNGSTIASNSAQVLGAGVIGGVGTEIRNSIFWDNVVHGDDETFDDELAQIEGIEFAQIDYSTIQGWTGRFGGVGNIGSDPLFIRPVRGEGWNDPWSANLRLLSDSPAINSGDPAFMAEPGDADLDGHTRVLCDRVDMGAYEFGIGDYDCDRDVDAADTAAFPQCMTGPTAAISTFGLLDVSAFPCTAFDFDADGDVDLADFSGLQRLSSPALR